ncbi:hypothetical protein [Sphingomonas sp. ID0503]|uniref:hypothetical protein n=1 Tax=Sphingomonas sp. ID0503 TaxID=3399691 RepID=UPI003AFADB54
MDLDALLLHYFGTDDPNTLSDFALKIGLERLSVDFGTENEPSRRFALWTLLEVFDQAPPPAMAFEKDEALRRAAEDYLTAAFRMERDEDPS